MKRILTILFTLACFSSCEDVEQPMTRDFTESSFWRDSQDALDALTSCYENMYSGDYFFANEALSDNAYNKSNSFEGVGQIASGGYDARTPRVSNEWGYHYTCIRKCNVVLENVDRISGASEELVNRIKAEARFIRAFSLFHLTTWYGDVPLVTKVLSLTEAKEFPRSTHAEVTEYVLSELNDIQQFLPTSYPDTDRGRITRAAAIGIRARVNLYEGKWDAVISDCDKLIHSSDNGFFALHPDYGALFTVAAEYNREIIFDLQFGGSRLQTNQRLFLPQTVGKLRANLVPTKALVDNYVMLNGKGIDDAGSGYDEDNPYANRDPRMEHTILHHGSEIEDFDGVTQTILTEPGSDPVTNTIEDQGASATGYYFKKYYDPTAVNYNSGVNLILLRYADVLLMYAEAMQAKGQFTESVWDETIKPIRNRAGFMETSATTFDAGMNQIALGEVIQQERRSEFGFEGLRVFDIRRLKLAEQVLNEPVKGIKVSGQFPKDEDGYLIVEERVFQNPKHYYWPVPQFEVDQNPNLLPNNEGW
ncbi:MAG: RagB/SusD family nutrient uptake outer membrane protein [Chryseolinea sp.]